MSPRVMSFPHSHLSRAGSFRSFLSCAFLSCASLFRVPLSRPAVFRLAGLFHRAVFARVCLLAALGLFTVGPIRAAHADNASDHFELGVKHYNSNKMDDALAEFQKAHELSPKEPTSLFWIGFLLLQQRHYQEALQPTLDALALRPKEVSGHLNLGNIYDGLKRYADAAKEFETAIKLENNTPRLADAYYMLGNSYLKLDRKPEALTALLKAASLAPKDPYTQDGLGYAYQLSGNFAAAIPAHQAATRLAPNNSGFWLNLALAQKTVALKQLTAKTAAERAAGLTMMEASQDSLAHAVKLAPEDYVIRESHGETLLELKRDEEAAAEFKKAAALNPKDYKPLYNLAIAQARLKRNDAATEAYRGVLALEPNNLDALQWIGAMQYQHKQYAEAALTFQKLTTLKPTSPAIWLDYSLSLQNAGKTEVAANVQEEALKHVGTGPTASPLRLSLALHYYQQGDPTSLARASDLYAQVAQNDPNNANAYNGMGLIAQKARKYDEAITQFKKATTVNPKFDDAFNNLGVTYEAQGDNTQALANIRKALQINPNSRLARENLARMTKGPAPNPPK